MNSKAKKKKKTYLTAVYRGGAAVYRANRAADRASRAVGSGSARGAAYRRYRAVNRGWGAVSRRRRRGRGEAAADGEWWLADGEALDAGGLGGTRLGTG
jgi:hypothetical protein